MKIENNNFNMLIENVEVGECFIFKDKLYMKIDNGCIEGNTNFPNLVINLYTNKLSSIEDGVIVKKADAKIVIE